MTKPRTNRVAEHLFGRSIFIENRTQLFQAHFPGRIPQDFGIKLHLVAEVILHQRNVLTRAPANSPDGRSPIPALGKLLARRPKNFVACPVLGRGWFKQTFNLTDVSAGSQDAFSAVLLFSDSVTP
jgi:hypothetical protein